MEICDYAHYTVFLHWLHSLRCFTPLLLKRYLWLRSLHCFTFTTIKMKYLNTFSSIFYFTTSNPRDHSALTTLLLSLIHQIVFPQKFHCFHIICMCDNSFTFRKFSGVLRALLPQKIRCNQNYSTKILWNDNIYLLPSTSASRTCHENFFPNE